MFIEHCSTSDLELDLFQWVTSHREYIRSASIGDSNMNSRNTHNLEIAKCELWICNQKKKKNCKNPRTKSTYFEMNVKPSQRQLNRFRKPYILLLNQRKLFFLHKLNFSFCSTSFPGCCWSNQQHPKDVLIFA